MAEVKATLSEVSQTINLKEWLGVDLSDRADIRQAVGQSVIDYMVERVKSGRGFGNKQLKPKYSDEYTESDEFKAFGKSKAGPVNMTLTGQMLDSITLLDDNEDEIKIGIDDPDETPKAFNHQTGDSPGMPKREFFGLSNAELKDLKGKLKGEIKSIIKEGANKKEVNDLILGKIADLIAKKFK